MSAYDRHRTLAFDKKNNGQKRPGLHRNVRVLYTDQKERSGL